MSQSNVFSQVIKQISRSDFEASVWKHGGDKRTRSLDCWTWFGALLFGQLSGHDSIRAIERVFCHGNKRLQKLGFSTICRSTLADANHARPLEILEETFTRVVARINQFAPPSQFLNIPAKDILLMDSTTISLCLNLCPWAKNKRNIGGIKLHTAIDLAGEIPQFAVITEARMHDIRAAKSLWREAFPKGSTVVFDRAYVDDQWFFELSQNKIFFVTRAKKHQKFKVLESRPTNRTQGYLCDQIIAGKKRSTRRPRGKLRRIVYLEPDTNKRYVFLTNRFDLSTEAICDLYKARWKVELFFKTLKQNLKIKKFLGTSEKAVKAQVLIALIAYALIQLIRITSKIKISMPDTMAVIGTLLLMNESLTRLLGDLPRVKRHPQGPQLSLRFVT